MRRLGQQLEPAEAQRILSECTNGVLSLTDPDGGEPYGVPLSFAYDEGELAIWFHSARAGRKIDCIAEGSRCSFCVISADDVVPEKFTTYFRSVIVAGAIRPVSAEEEIMRGLQMLCKKYSPGIDSEAEIASCLNRVVVLRLDIESITGKQAIELVRQ